MELKDIRELVKLLDKSSVTEIELEKEDFKLRVAKNADVQYVSQAAVAMPAAAAPAAAAPAPVSETAAVATSENTGNYKEVKSPMVGTYYAAPAPEADNFVKVGDSVSEGQTLCIIEAMKLMNEFKAETSGKIVKILVNNSEPVEYNQVLFHIE
jgi:acetyl-CoA carboxylase biotin carboxyl carrier protein